MQFSFIVIEVSIILALAALAKMIIDFVTRTFYIHKLPGPPRRDLIFGNLIQLGRDRGEFFKNLQKVNLEYYPIYKLRIGHISFCSILCPEDIELVCSNVKHNSKGRFYNLLSNWLKKGLLTSDGEKWHRRRKLLAPSFHFTILQQFVPIFNEAADCCVQALKNQPEIVSVVPLMSQFTLKSIAETSMGTKLNFNTEIEKSYKNAVDEIGEVFREKAMRPYLFPKFIYIFSSIYRREVKLIKTLHSFTKELIEVREKEFQADSMKKLPMLDSMIAAKYFEGTIDDDGIREEVDTFIFAGHDTTASAISFTLMMLACHPDVQELVVKEMGEVFGGLGRKPDFRDLQQMKYLERCIKEVLRLYPSAFLISRKLGESIVTKSGYFLKKDSLMFLHIYGLHHNPNIYPEPDRFDPDRFLPENCKKRHPFAYIPFSAGSRNCVGQKFAMLEIKTVICAILENFILEPVDTPDTIELIVDIVLKARRGIKVKFTKRQ